MKTVRTLVENLYINEYVVTVNGIYDVIDITYDYDSEKFLVHGRNIETDEMKIYSANTYRVLVKN